MKKQLSKLSINLGLLICGFLGVVSGLVLQVTFHIGNHGGEAMNGHVRAIGYKGWSDIHKVSILLMSILMIIHIYLHWKWYKTIINKRLFRKNKQVLTLSVIFAAAAISGFIAWIIDFMNASQSIRNTFIEIHDKVALVLVVYLILHVIKRLRWYVSTLNKIKDNKILDFK